MEHNSKPTETDIVLVHDKILMALLAANGIQPVHVFMSGWPDDPKHNSETYMVYKQTEKASELITSFENRNVSVNLDEYLMSADELEWRIGKITYEPKDIEGIENE